MAREDGGEMGEQGLGGGGQRSRRYLLGGGAEAGACSVEATLWGKRVTHGSVASDNVIRWHSLW